VTYGTKESRLIEAMEAWKERALAAEAKVRELEWTIQCIGERTAPRTEPVHAPLCRTLEGKGTCDCDEAGG
jgi:hypothetical protein